MKSSNKTYEAYYAQYDNSFVDSRWAEPEEIKNILTPVDLQNPLSAVGGVPCLVEGNTAYLDSGDGHTIVFGSSGSKKSRNIAIPQTILNLHAGESMIISDCKGEIYE